MRSLGEAVLLNNLINSETFSKEIYVDDFVNGLLVNSG